MFSKLPASTAKCSLAALLGLALAMPPAWAQTPVLNLSDLVNQGSDYVQRELRNRGYVFIQGDPRGSKLWQYWWQSRDYVCARVAHVDGRASSIVEVSPTDCNQYQPVSSTASQDSSKSSGVSNAAKVAIAAAAITGVAVLAHRSHERDESKHNTEQQVAEYDRGYRDGLYHQPYHDYNRSQSYVDGYQAGQERRDAETGYRSPYGYHSGQGSYVSLNDMIGSSGSGADSVLRKRGFVDKGGYTSGNSSFSTWWNASTRQCVKLVISDGQVRAVNPINEGSCN